MPLLLESQSAVLFRKASSYVDPDVFRWALNRSMKNGISMIKIKTASFFNVQINFV